MKYIICVLFLAFHTAKCFKKPIKRGETINKNCQDIKCPPVDEPVCARVTNTNNNNKTLYIIMVNQCEMEYVKCHQGLHASIVDMKHCGHDEYKTLNKLLKDKGRKRIKRDANRGEIVILDNVNMTAPSIEDTNGFEDTSLSDKEVNRDVSPEIKIDDTEYNEISEPENNVSETEDSGDGLADDKLLPDGGEVKQEYPMPDIPVTSDALPDKDLNTENKLPDSVPETDKLDDNAGNLSEELENKIKFTDKTIFEDDRQPNDYAIYEGNCPTSCPTRDVMVCAKCQHNIYKTFMSVCHMRMFSCWFTEEELELVSRYPCVMSAPFLSTKPDTEPKGRVKLADDEDRILKFIYCREKGDPSHMEGKNKLLFPENIYPNCDLIINTKRKLS